MVSDAENAEKDADRALVEARNRVRLAREHVQTLEKEALEEYVLHFVHFITLTCLLVLVVRRPSRLKQKLSKRAPNPLAAMDIRSFQRECISFLVL